MSEFLRLSAYFGERQRHRSRFVAEEIFDRFSRRGVASSIMLRGISGYGARHVLRTDESLSLSEDPPVTIAAVDTTTTIAALAEEIAAVMPRGLLTSEPAWTPGTAALPAGETVTLTIALGRNRRVGGRPAFAWACDLLHRRDFAGAAAFVGVDGTSHGERRRARFFSRNLDVPLVVVAVGTAAQAHAAMPELLGALPDPLAVVESAQVCKRDGVLLGRPRPADGPGTWQKLTVHTSEATLADGAPIHRALVRLLRQHRAAAGATVLRGIWGFHGDHRPHGDRLIQFGRQVPVTTVVVDTAENVSRAFDIVDRVTGRHGLVTCQAVASAVIPGR